MQRTRRGVSLALLTAALCVAAPLAVAWGPVTQVAIVATAAQVLAKSNVVGMQRTMRDLQQGASLGRDQLLALYPEMEANPLHAIEQEMQLLSAVRGDRIEPFFAFRMGALGKLVAGVAAPMQNASAAHRNLYYSDVDKVIGATTLQSGARTVVEVRPYFQRVFAEVEANDTVIEQEYQSGLGFSAVARSTVGRDASRAVDAVADVLYTVVQTRMPVGAVSETQLRRYALAAYQFYIRRGNDLEIDAAEKRLDELVSKTPQMREQIGDMFFAAGMKERAMTEYRGVLQEAPERTEVAAKMAEYYRQQGTAALEQERFTVALDAFQQAIQANPLDTDAERMRLRTESAMQDKQARQASAQNALVRAGELVTMAEQEAVRGLYAEATSLLQQALHTYGEAGTEFPAETQERMRGEDRVRNRIREYKRDLIANARMFSGSGYEHDVRRMAETRAVQVDERVLQGILSRQYEAEISQLEAGLREVR